MAICQAASCVLRDAACAIPNGDAASLIGPLAALCEKAVRAVAARADAAVASTRARLALAQRSQDWGTRRGSWRMRWWPSGARPARPSTAVRPTRSGIY